MSRAEIRKRIPQIPYAASIVSAELALIAYELLDQLDAIENILDEFIVSPKWATEKMVEQIREQLK